MKNALKHYRDIKNSIDTAWFDGEKIEIEKGDKLGIEKEREKNKNKK